MGAQHPLVVVALDQVDLPVQPVEVIGSVMLGADQEIAEMPDGVGRPHRPVPGRDQHLVHLRHRGERTLAIADRGVMAEMRIGCEEERHL
jgi:hypothetical protein